MDGLRWLLLLFGLLVIAGVYFYSRREKSDSGDKVASLERMDPFFDREDIVRDEHGGAVVPELSESADEIESDVRPQELKADLQQKIVTVRIVARENHSFAGDELILCLRGIGLRHGKFGIFHRYDGSDESSSIFSAASLVEPGSFNLENIKNQSIPGISLFLVLPGPIDSVEAFEMMMIASRTLARSLGGELLDETGSTLSIQRERYLREEIIQFQHSNLVA